MNSIRAIARRSTKTTVQIPATFEPVGEYADQLARLAAILLMRTAMTEERRDFGHYFDIHRDEFRDEFGGGWHLIKRESIEQGLLEEQPSRARKVDSTNSKSRGCYSVGEHAIGYRLASQHRHAITSTYVMGRRPRTKTKKLKRCTEDALTLVLKDRLALVEVPEWVRPSDQWGQFSLNRIWANDIYAGRCEHGRLHTNFTAIAKTVRSTLVVKNDPKIPLVSLDIKNAQPLIMGATLTQSQSHISLCGTLMRFLELCEQGQLYEHILNRVHEGVAEPYLIKDGHNQYWVDPKTWNREHVKKAFLICLFDRVDSMKRNPVFKVLEAEFREIAAQAIAKKQDRYQALAGECQREESRLMIDGVARRFAEQFLFEPIVTIHDELIVAENRVDAAISLIFDEFGRLGIKPKLNVKLLSETAPESVNV